MIRIKIKLEPNNIYLVPENDDERQSIKEFYPYHKARINAATQWYRISKLYLPKVLERYRGISPENAHCKLNAKQYKDYSKIINLSKVDCLKAYGPDGDGYVNENLQLRPHQQLAREIAKVQDKYAFYFDTRTGKTPLSLAIINDDLEKNPEHKWLVVCPLILMKNAWAEDIGKFFPDMKPVLLHDKLKAKRLELFKNKSNLYIINTESFASYIDSIKELGIHGMILDESSVLKSPTTTISKTMVEITNNGSIEQFYMLAGTPAPNGEWEYYTQMLCIDKFGWQQSYMQFKTYYFNNLSYEPRYDKLVLKNEKRDEFNNHLSKYSIYVDKEDVLITPGREFIEHRYEMDKYNKDTYKAMKNEMCAELEERPEEYILAASAGVKVNKLNQISSGFIINTETKETFDLSEKRKEVLKDILLEIESNEPGAQVIIWANYKKEFADIKDVIESNFMNDFIGILNGDVSASRKNEYVHAFKKKDIRWLLCNPASADKGLTLTCAHYCVYYSLNHSYELYKQSMDRIYGDISIQPNKCKYYVILAKHTIDEVIYDQVLTGKQDTSYAILDHLKSEAL